MMASKYWIKLYHEILDDPKMGLMPDNLWRRTIELFLLAGEIDDGGNLPGTEEISWRLRIVTETLQNELRELQRKNILSERENGKWFIVKFAERQSAVSDAERMQRYRQRERKTPKSYVGVTIPVTNPVTNRNTDTDTDTDIDVDVVAKKPRKPRPPLPPALQVFFELTGKLPAKAIHADIIAMVGDKPQDLELWRRIVKAYGGMGWNPHNANGMLDYFKRREIPAPKRGNGNGRDPTPPVATRPPGLSEDDYMALEYIRYNHDADADDYRAELEKRGVKVDDYLKTVS